MSGMYVASYSMVAQYTTFEGGDVFLRRADTVKASPLATAKDIVKECQELISKNGLDENGYMTSPTLSLILAGKNRGSPEMMTLGSKNQHCFIFGTVALLLDIANRCYGGDIERAAQEFVSGRDNPRDIQNEIVETINR